MIKKSKIFGFNARDVLYSFLVAVFGSIITALHQLFASGLPFRFDWQTFEPIVYTGLTAGFAYLVKNFFSNSGGAFAKPEKSGPGGGSNPPEGPTGLP